MVFISQYHLTNAPQSSSSACCHYQKDKPVKHMNLQTKECSFGYQGALDTKVFSLKLKDNTMVMAAFQRTLAVTLVAADCIISMARHSRDEKAHKHTECF